jgi:hypothetical protein
VRLRIRGTITRLDMLEIRRTAIALEEEELIELETIMVDCDEKEALCFLKKSVYNKVADSQEVKKACSNFNPSLRT